MTSNVDGNLPVATDDIPQCELCRCSLLKSVSSALLWSSTKSRTIISLLRTVSRNITVSIVISTIVDLLLMMSLYRVFYFMTEGWDENDYCRIWQLNKVSLKQGLRCLVVGSDSLCPQPQQVFFGYTLHFVTHSFFHPVILLTHVHIIIAL